MNKNVVKRAVIPLAGLGTRIFPMNKIINKAFLPIYKDGMLKPVILIIIEELLECGIEKIGLIIRKEDKKIYDELFSSKKEYTGKYIENASYNKIIENISGLIEYIYEEKPLGLGHAVYISKEFSKDKNIITILGDHIFKSDLNENCTIQFLSESSKNENLILSIKEVPLDMVENYGIISGEWVDGREGELLEIQNFIEKPSKEYASENLGINTFGELKYYSVFGHYLISKHIYKELETNIILNKKIKEEFDLTDAISKVIKNKRSFALVIKGNSFDVGLPILYKKAMEEYDK